MSQLIVQLISNMMVIALPNIITDLNFIGGNILWVNLIYLCSLVAFSIPLANVISIRGVEKITKLSLIALLISIILSVFTVNQYMLLLSRLIQGLTSASLSTCVYMFIVKELPDEDVGSALGIVGSAGYLGMLIAPSFMGFMIHLANWRFAFLILIPIMIIQLLLVHNLSFDWSSEKKSIDIFGSLLYVSLMILFTVGLESIDNYGFILILISTILFVVFYKHEKQIENPIYNLNLIKDKNYLIGNYVAMVVNFSVTIAVTILSFHLQYILDIEEYVVGLILIISPILMVGMAPPAGKLSNKFDPRLISSIALLFILIAMIIYALMDNLPFEIIILACILQGTGTGLFSAPNNKYVLTLVDEKDLPDATSLLATGKEFGKILSNSAFAVILSLLIGNQSLGPDYLDETLFTSINIMMVICAILVLSAVLFLFYSIYKYRFKSNPNVLKIFRRYTPDWLKKIYK